MKENRIISFIGVQGSLILANTMSNVYLQYLFIGLTLFYLIEYLYLSFKN